MTVSWPWTETLASEVLTDEQREILEAVLTYHYRKDIQFCGCGWSVLGKSHPKHVIEVFEESCLSR